MRLPPACVLYHGRWWSTCQSLAPSITLAPVEGSPNRQSPPLFARRHEIKSSRKCGQHFIRETFRASNSRCAAFLLTKREVVLHAKFADDRSGTNLEKCAGVCWCLFYIPECLFSVLVLVKKNIHFSLPLRQI